MRTAKSDLDRGGLSDEEAGRTASSGSASTANALKFSAGESQALGTVDARPNEEAADLPDFEMDSKGNLYRKGSGKASRWWRRMSGIFTRRSSGNDDRDIVR